MTSRVTRMGPSGGHRGQETEPLDANIAAVAQSAVVAAAMQMAASKTTIILVITMTTTKRKHFDSY